MTREDVLREFTEKRHTQLCSPVDAYEMADTVDTDAMADEVLRLRERVAELEVLERNAQANVIEACRMAEEARQDLLSMECDTTEEEVQMEAENTKLRAENAAHVATIAGMRPLAKLGLWVLNVYREVGPMGHYLPLAAAQSLDLLDGEGDDTTATITARALLADEP